MPTLLYALTLPGESLPAAVSGVAGEPVRGLRCGVLTAVVGTTDRKPTPTLETIQAHDDVLRATVVAGATVAAVRFGQLFDDDAACEREVRARGERVATLLQEHQGCVEMRVLTTLAVESPAAPASATPGRAYLESLRAPRPPAGATLAPELGPLIRAERVELTSTSGRTARGVAYIHLVHRTSLDAYRATVSRVMPEARVVGPLALHSFAEPSAA